MSKRVQKPIRSEMLALAKKAIGTVTNEESRYFGRPQKIYNIEVHNKWLVISLGTCRFKFPNETT